jgi:glutamyl-tRNA(Gln) amidotransferase subunit D
MARPIAERFAAAGVQLGDTVRLVKDGRVDEGILMPRHAFSQPDVAILKLKSGYNVGIRVDDATAVELVRRGEARPRLSRASASDPAKPVVAVLGTGGTIASYVDYRTGAVHPAATAEELAFATPEIFEVAQVRAEVVYQVFSEDLAPKNWLELARRAKTAFDQGARGVVVPHGTDTLGYTAAALAFLLRDLPGPVVLVGAQRSSDRPSSDAATNLVAACRVAANADLGEVVVAMHEGPDDTRIALHRGVRVRKDHSSRRDAFRSHNAPPLGYVEGEEVHLTEPHRPRARGPCRVANNIADDVALLHSYPGLDGDTLERLATGRGLVVAGTGLGHLPNRTLEAVARLQRRGVLVVMATQCLWGRTDLKVYSTGRDLVRQGVVPAHDMLPETAFAKLCWVLGNAADRRQALEWLETDQAGEFSPRTPMDGVERPG